MQYSAKTFAKKLNHCLDESGAPSSPRDRANVLSKLLDIPRQQAWSLLEGHQAPDEDTIKQIANEFEVDMLWLTSEGQTTKA